MKANNIRAVIRQTRILDKLERPFATEVRREKNRYIDAQAQNYRAFRQLSDDGFIEHKQKLSQILKKHHIRALRIFSGDASRNMPKCYSLYEKKRDIFSILLQEWVNQQGADKVQDIAQTTHNDLRKVLLTAIAGDEQAGDVIRQMLAVRSFSRQRAAVIARTETHNAAMFASKRTAEVLAADVDMVILKRWVPALDERTRASHAAMVRHEPIAMDSLFKVGADRMDRPGDPSASPGNVINCRCVLVYEEKENA